ncbi:hypothetical protein [Actinoalloteichus hymeniacidonis]|uniref:Uncharacterized protein n=1 Tax=Actinoalloteichus hymeniacidonis TaxID=340345 RepID=A0AAC9N0L0_9PSEU|nr:hypothetical protein [Actinoalloteichus hymeniacidonis]AOS65475.1 hypothetical protein TL08_23475 [Actinoalloteichus hymeniacidonis]MBB5906438.1 hypothetical protein [Actinoalloteichus hymeniacidonis]
MSAAVEFQMHRIGGEIVNLASLLDMVPDNDWVWSVLEFDGLGQVPADLGYEEFRETVLSSPQGYVMSWRELRAFAAGVRQCFDLTLVAVRDRRVLDSDRFAANDFRACAAVLTASDSTYWSVEADAEFERTCQLVARVRSRYGSALR